MKCQNCGKSIKRQAKSCKYCGVRIIQKSDKMAKKMTMDGGIAMACGGLMVIIAIVMAIYGGRMWAAIILILGCLLTFIGKKIG